MKINKPKVLVGMSGGVDSSVAALLLKKQGFDVIGGFMKNWSEDNCIFECTWLSERRDAMRVAAKLEIPFKTFDFEDKYRKDVYQYMIDEYKAGRTPNPDVLCNKFMKFGYFLDEAKKLGCDFVATGHYARVKNDNKGVAHLFSGKDKKKDQSYFLCRLNQDQLKKTLFPIGDLKKSKVRKIAQKNNLHIADKKDSQGICFVGKVQMSEFLKKEIPEQQGNIIDQKGNVLGKHRGHMYYTIGQRHGLDLAKKQPYFVIERRADKNQIVVAHEHDKALFNNQVSAVDIIQTSDSNFEDLINKKIDAMIRYRQKPQSCRISKFQDNKVEVKFDKPQRAVAPGQFIAFYKGKELIGSGIIE